MLLFEITKMLIAVQGKDFIVSFVIIFGTFVTIRYTRCYFDVRSKANISQLDLPHGTKIKNVAKTTKK